MFSVFCKRSAIILVALTCESVYMIPINNISGRLGNQMFQLAFLYTYSRKHNLDIYFQDPKFYEKYKAFENGRMLGI
jgi:hypothetical protein